MLARDGFAGVMSFTLAESLWLAGERLRRRAAGATRRPTGPGSPRLTADPALARAVTVMVDDVGQLDLIDAARGGGGETSAGLPRTGHRLAAAGRPGADRRAALPGAGRGGAGGAGRVRWSAGRGSQLVGLMAYEGHVAGVGDAVPGRPLRSAAIRRMQAAARGSWPARRAEVVRAVRAVAPGLEFVNGGGTGSVQHTAAEDAVTEVAAGSGLFAPRCSTPTPPSAAGPPRCSRSRWCAGPGPGW